MIHQPSAALAQLETTHFIGKPLFLDLLILHLKVAFSSSILTFQLIIHSSHQNSHSQPESTTQTSTATERYALIYSGRSGHLRLQFQRFFSPSAHFFATQTQMTPWSQRSPGSTKTI